MNAMIALSIWPQRNSHSKEVNLLIDEELKQSSGLSSSRPVILVMVVLVVVAVVLVVAGYALCIDWRKCLFFIPTASSHYDLD